MRGLDKRLHHIQQLVGGDDGRRAACLHNGGCHASTLLQFTVEVEHVGNLLLAVVGDNPRRIVLRVAVHAHVEVAVEAERETALAVVEVVETHAQVGKHTVHTLHAVVAHEVFQKGEISVYKCKSAIVDAVGVCVHVLVHTVEPSALTQMLHYLTAMAATAKSHVHISAVGLDVKSCHALVEQCRNMVCHLFSHRRKNKFSYIRCNQGVKLLIISNKFTNLNHLNFVNYRKSY